MLTRARLREKVKPVARRLRSAAHLSRLSILYLLAHEPMIARDIVDSLGLTENLVAHHLKQLYLGRWVRKTRQGREVKYQLKDKNFFEFFRLFENTAFEKDVIKKYVKWSPQSESD